jgi:hypothetical protein
MCCAHPNDRCNTESEGEDKENKENNTICTLMEVCKDEWAKVLPHVGERPTHCPILQADLHPGHFVLYHSDQVDSDQVGRIIETQVQEADKRMFLLNIFVSLKESGIAVTPLTNSRSEFITELVQTKNTILVSPTKIVNIAFVHLASDVESDEVFGWQGVFNFYLLRYRSDEKLVDKYLPYPCLHENFTGYRDDYSYRMFLFLNRFRKELSRRIGRWGIGQGKNTVNYGQVATSSEEWYYVKLCCAIEVSTDRKRRKIDRVVEPGMTLKSIRREVQTEHMSFQTSEELPILQKLLGDMCLYEVRKKRPKVGEERGLHWNDELNVICSLDGRSSECVWDPRNKYKPGIDVYFNREDMLSLVIRYEKYQVQGTKERLIRCPSSILEKLILLFTPLEKNASRHTYTVSLEDEFEHPDDNEIYRVDSICQSGRTAEAESLQSGNRDTFSLRQIIPWILNRLSLGGDSSSE